MADNDSLKKRSSKKGSRAKTARPLGRRNSVRPPIQAIRMTLAGAVLGLGLLLTGLDAFPISGTLGPDAAFAGDRNERRIRNYQDLSPREKERLKKKYKKWESYPPDKRQKIRRNKQRWEKMSPDQRKTYRDLKDRYRNMNPNERRDIQKKLRNWNNLSPQERENLKRKFKR